MKNNCDGKQLALDIIGQLLLAFLLLTNGSIYAQQPRHEKTIAINTDLVVTWAQVTRPQDGSPIKGLGIDDILLYEEGKQQQLSLMKEGQPLSVVILVDGMTCLSEPKRWYQRREEMLRQLGEDAEIALMAWDSDVVLVYPLTTDHKIVADKLSDKRNFFYALNPHQGGPEIQIRPERTWYRPGEAIYQAAKYLEKAAATDRRKLIVVITYTDIRMAEKHFRTADEVKLLLWKTGTMVSVLSHHMPDEYKDHYSPLWHAVAAPYTPALLVSGLRRRSGGTLNQFVALSGGTTLSGAWEECDELFIRLARMIRSSYTIGYYPENENFDGRFRRLKVELSPSGKVKAGKANIKTRSGYVALRRTFPTASEGNK